MDIMYLVLIRSYFSQICFCLILLLTSCQKDDILAWDLKKEPRFSSILISKINENTVTVYNRVFDLGGARTLKTGYYYSILNVEPNESESFILNTDITESGIVLADIPCPKNSIVYVRFFAENENKLIRISETKLIANYDEGAIGPHGGYIFYKKPYVDSIWNFLECKPYDNQEKTFWSYGEFSNWSYRKALGHGDYNTRNMLMVEAPPLVYQKNVFKAVDALNEFSWKQLEDGEFSNNWYLPNLFELNRLKTNLHMNGLGNFENDAYYWSSTADENFNENAWNVKFNNSTVGATFTVSKLSELRIRAVRKL